MKGRKSMTLSKGQRGKTYTAVGIELENDVKRRLEILGLTQKSKVLVLNSKGNGSMIIKVRGTRFAIGKKIAEGIIIDEN